MSKNRLHTISSKNFKYNQFDKQFSATISQLGCNGIDSNCVRFFNKLEHGVGFILVSDRTNKQMVMQLVRTNRIPSDWNHEDFDVTSWIFKPVDHKHQFELKLIND